MSLNRIIVGILAGVSFLGCDYQTKPEECCQCLVDNQCTVVAEERCLDVFQVLYGQDSIEVNGNCVKENGCYLPCAEGGVYFEQDKMVFKKNN
tara:strand:- start:33 stop:311 length:279 start_codon:yes stop_codon:yes gene_type:complete